MRTFDEDLAAAVAYHGHLCPGQVLGVRVARMGLAYLGIDDPATYRDLIVFVECDRCLADAVCTVTHCTLGRRRLKYRDQGKMAATFLDLATGKAVRIYVSGQAHSAPGDDPVEFYGRFTDEEFFTVEDVKVDLSEYDLPGHPKKSVVCAMCGEDIKDNREVVVDGKTLCRTCAGIDRYYTVIGTHGAPAAGTGCGCSCGDDAAETGRR